MEPPQHACNLPVCFATRQKLLTNHLFMLLPNMRRMFLMCPPPLGLGGAVSHDFGRGNGIGVVGMVVSSIGEK